LSKKSARSHTGAVVFQFNASPRLALVLTLVHAGALALLVPVDVPLWLRALLALLLLASLYRTVTHHALRSTDSAVTALHWRDGEGIALRLGRKSALRAARIRSRFVHRSLVLLSVQLEGSRRAIALAIAADALEAGAFRRLRVALLESAQTPAA
jgi:hypothetical protein